MGSYFTMVACVFRGLGEFLLHLLWLAISEGLTVDFFRSEIQMIRAKVNEHSDGPESPKTEKFPDYVSLHPPHSQNVNY